MANPIMLDLTGNETADELYTKGIELFGEHAYETARQTFLLVSFTFNDAVIDPTSERHARLINAMAWGVLSTLAASNQIGAGQEIEIRERVAKVLGERRLSNENALERIIPFTIYLLRRAGGAVLVPLPVVDSIARSEATFTIAPPEDGVFLMREIDESELTPQQKEERAARRKLGTVWYEKPNTPEGGNNGND